MARKSTNMAGQGGAKRSTLAAVSPPAAEPATGMRAWHLLTLGLMTLAAAGAIATREGGTVQTVGVTVMILTTGLVAAGVFRSLAPLVEADAGDPGAGNPAGGSADQPGVQVGLQGPVPGMRGRFEPGPL